MATIAKNSKASYDYDIKETFDAGLVLEGREVKSVKTGNVSLTGSYVSVHDAKATLIGCHIGPYTYAPSEGYNPTRSRTILLNKKELLALSGKEKGLTIVPLEIYTTRNLIKLKIGLGRARKKADKREHIKKKEAKNEIRKITR